MPKDTFFNLDGKKQRRIFQAAVKEFSARRFSEASINQIIKGADIPRGSFYQYFADKEDLYLYVITEIGKEKKEYLIQKQTDTFTNSGDFFTYYLHLYELGLCWAGLKPEYNKIFLLMELDDSDFISILRQASREGFAILKGMLVGDQERGLIRDDVDLDLLLDILYQLMLHTFKHFYQQGSGEEAQRRLAQILEIIKVGVAVK